MNGLVGTRVIVVDDVYDEALPIIKELSRRGISSAYFNGTESELPVLDHPLSAGVRLAILDMDLIGGNASDIDKIASLKNVLRRIISPQNGPFGVIAWTNKEDLINKFEKATFELPEFPKPIFVIPIEKGECMKGNVFNLEIISEKIDTSLSEYSPLLLFNIWEGICFSAATEVSNDLSSLLSVEAENPADWRVLWKRQCLNLMHTLAEAEAGQQLNKIPAITSLYGSMNPLLTDRMENNTDKALIDSLSFQSAEIIKAENITDSQVIAKLNSRLHLSICNQNGFRAGNIYLSTQFGESIPTALELLTDIADAKDNNMKDLESTSHCIVIEINAKCDHAQNGVRIARFVSGLITPTIECKKFKKADFIYKLGPMFLDSPEIKSGEYNFYFSARHLSSVELNKVKDITPIGRLRSQALSDLQVWFANRASRPGLLLLKE